MTTQDKGKADDSASVANWMLDAYVTAWCECDLRGWPDWMLDAYVTAWCEPTNDDFARAYLHWQMTLACLDPSQMPYGALWF